MVLLLLLVVVVVVAVLILDPYKSTVNPWCHPGFLVPSGHIFTFGGVPMVPMVPMAPMTALLVDDYRVL